MSSSVSVDLCQLFVVEVHSWPFSRGHKYRFCLAMATPKQEVVACWDECYEAFILRPFSSQVESMSLEELSEVLAV